MLEQKHLSGRKCEVEEGGDGGTGWGRGGEITGLVIILSLFNVPIKHT